MATSRPASVIPPVDAMLIIWGNVDPKTAYNAEPDLNAWWTNEHLLERLAIPGFVRCRRYWAYDMHTSMSKYLVCYETTSTSVFTSPAYIYALNHPTQGTSKYIQALTKLNRSVCRILYSQFRPEVARSGYAATGATIGHIVLRPQGDFARLEHEIMDLGRDILSSRSVLSFRLLEFDDGATAAGSSTKSYDGSRLTDWSNKTWFTEWQVMIEYAEPIGAPFAEHTGVTDNIARGLRKLGITDVKAQHYQLVCAMTR